MIHYALRCAESHEFDGWFASSDGFDRQCAAGLVECPNCGSVQVSRGLMAPALSRGAETPVRAGPVEPAKAVLPAPGLPAPGLPAELRAGLQKLRAAVEAHCDYVGPDFAAQARQMHRGEVPARAIYGEASRDQAESLQDEGIEIGRIPWVPKADG